MKILKSESSPKWLQSKSTIFGQGGVDDAEDMDVILHELGHGLHDWITNGNLITS